LKSPPRGRYVHHPGALGECRVYGGPWGRPAPLPRRAPAAAGGHRLRGVSSAGRGSGRDREWSTPGFWYCGVYAWRESRFCRRSTGHYWRCAVLRLGPQLLHHPAGATGRPGAAGVVTGPCRQDRPRPHRLPRRGLPGSTGPDGIALRDCGSAGVYAVGGRHLLAHYGRHAGALTAGWWPHPLCSRSLERSEAW
jgi:hypothetical protein